MHRKAQAQTNQAAVAPRTTKGTYSKLGATHSHTLSSAKSVKKMFDNHETFSLDGLALVQQASMAEQYSCSSTLRPYPLNSTNDINI